MPEKDLPVMLPENVDITGNGRFAAREVPEFVNVTCPEVWRPGAARNRHDGHVRRLVLVFLSLHRPAQRSRRPLMRKRRATGCRSINTSAASSTPFLHLIYSRFWTKLMRDMGMSRTMNRSSVCSPKGWS